MSVIYLIIAKWLLIFLFYHQKIWLDKGKF